MQLIPIAIEEDTLFDILFEMNRFYDKQFVKTIHRDQYANLKFNQEQRNLLRKYYYYGLSEFLPKSEVSDFPCYSSSEEDKIYVLNSFIDRCEIYDKEKIINSIVEKYNQISSKKVVNNCEDWLNYYDKKRRGNSDFSLFILEYDQQKFIEDNFELSSILKIISDIYDHLENYRHFIFKLKGKLFNKNNEDVTWKVLYKVGIFCENFIQYTGSFFPFKKQKSIEKLSVFLKEKFPSANCKQISEDFYSSISTGFKFEDCMISENQNHIILAYKKIKLDTSPIPCPSCMTTIQSGNSFPETFLRSYECKNPSCPDRSKSGRGKRFDEFGIYRYFKLQENKPENQISDELFSQWRRDVFSENNDVYDMLINYYAWDKEIICIANGASKLNVNSRIIIDYKPYNDSSYISDFNELPIYKLFSSISEYLPQSNGNVVLDNDLTIFNKDSTLGIQQLKDGQIGAAITSPPYYNAREYSWWSTMLLYFVDMMRNCNSVFNALMKDGYYLYNIGDIVNEDNIYVESNMSKKRLQLGFLTCMVFEIIGFNLAGNIIWDKGEVQSKRNSTPNHNSGYVKCINCYEHVFVFKKGSESKIVSDVKRIVPVIKINAKGINIHKHTAPYPLDLVELIRPFVKSDKYILDPFLGSGTTLRWCKQNNLKGIGYEINEEYFALSKQNVGIE